MPQNQATQSKVFALRKLKMCHMMEFGWDQSSDMGRLIIRYSISKAAVRRQKMAKHQRMLEVK